MNEMNNSIEIYSFDIFDTLITRPFMRPVDVFVTVGKTLVSRGYFKIDPQVYRDARERAERRARTASRPRDDCRWNEVFLQFLELSSWGVSADEAMEVEMEAERFYCSPIAENVGRVRGLLEGGAKVLFLSDMYLPADFIWELIRTHVADCSREDVYVSGELGLSKHTGRLYSHVIERYGIEPSQLRHLGDNPYADVEVPIRLGVNAEQYRGIHPTHYERLPRPRRYAPLALSAMRGTARAARLQIPPLEKMSQVASIATSVVAPVLTAFVAWVLRDARERKINRLYFVSRDGQILLLIASALRKDGDPECRYLYGSRQAWFLPSVQDLDDDSLNWAWMKGMSRTGRDILRRLEIDDEPVLTILTREGFDEANLGRQLDDNAFQRLKELIRKEPIASTLLEKAKTRRKLLLEYLAQEGCLDGTSWALVDIGWGLNCQHALNRLLKKFYWNFNVNGYYFGVSHDHAPINYTGSAHPFIAHSKSCLQGLCQADWLFKRSTIAIVENIFVISDQESVSGYIEEEESIKPIFKKTVPTNNNKELARIVHSSVFNYAKKFIYNRIIEPTSEEYYQQTVSMMKKFCLYPNQTEVLSIANIAINNDPAHGVEHWSKLASPINMRFLFNILHDYMFNRSKQNSQLKFSWVAGSAAISSWPVRIILISGSAVSRSLDSLRFFIKRLLIKVT